MPAAFSETRAAALARELYGLAGEATALPGEFDDNFDFRARDGRRFALKVMEAERERSLLELQCAALAHLAARAPELPLPRVVPALSGELLSTIPDGEGRARLVWLLSWIEGEVLARAKPRTPELAQSLGTFLGRLDAAFEGFSHPGAARELSWDLARAAWIGEHLGAITDPHRRALVERALARYHERVVPALAALPQSVIHGDANDYNVVVSPAGGGAREVVSVIDFGDMHRGVRVAELAVGAAYALFGQRDPLAALRAITQGYHAALPLTEGELAVLFPLVAMRLAVSVTTSALRQRERPDDPYVVISEAPAWEALAQIDAIPEGLAHAALRHACGLVPNPAQRELQRWLVSANPAPLLDEGFPVSEFTVLDLSAGSLLLGADPAAGRGERLVATIAAELAARSSHVAVGRFDEARVRDVEAGSHPTAEGATIHLGMDLFAPAGADVFAPFDGVVEALGVEGRAGEEAALVLRHHEAGVAEFFTLYRGLELDFRGAWEVGAEVHRGERLGAIEEGRDGAPSALVLQLTADLLGFSTHFPRFVRAAEREAWQAVALDPNLLLRVPAERFPLAPPRREESLAERRARIGGSVRLSYHRPLKMVRGFGQFLYDEDGRAYLDVYNNVPHVGHSHPRVVRAVQQQVALLNTNTRYLHDNILRYAERLTALLPAPLEVCFFVNSGSEANELALRLARAASGGEHVIVLEAAYHGHTGGLVDISPYKFAGPGGAGRKPWVHVAPLPDDYRGPYERSDPERGAKYAQHVGALAAEVVRGGGKLAAFIAETLPSVGGQIVLPPGYLAEVYRAVRAAGGIVIADEVQVGFGRLGTTFWGFEGQGVVPDVVVLGKPIANGFPLAAVFTTRAIAAAFDNGMEFFSTFGGNPVSCAAGLAVLDVLAEESLQENARVVGGQLLAGLEELTRRHAVAGDARGAGFFLGLELVKSRDTLEPAAEEASYAVNRLAERGILTGTDGPHHNVIKIRPPMVFNREDADLFLAVLDEVLGEDQCTLLQ